MQAAFVLSLPFGLDAPLNIGQVFEDNRAPRPSSVDDLLTQHMIATTAKSSLLAPDLPQVALGALGAGCLQGATQLERATFHGSPAFLAEKLVRAGDSRLRQAQIDAHDIVRWLDNRSRNVHDDMQPPIPIALDEIGGRDFAVNVGCRIRGHVERQTHPALRRGESHRTRVPIDLEGVPVVAWRACGSHRNRDLAALALQGQCALDGFGGFDAGLNVQVADESGRVGFAGVVGCVMQRTPFFSPCAQP